MRDKSSSVGREVAFYYPNPMWSNGDWIKNLILFFDGVALLVPDYMQNRPEQQDPAIVAGLEEHGLFHIIHPEEVVDAAATAKLADAFDQLMQSGRLDRFARPTTTFHELSRSRLGYSGDPGLADGLVAELRKRGLAKHSEDGVSIPMHPVVRTLVLVLLAQILRPCGKALNLELSPTTDRPELVAALGEVLGVDGPADASAVITADLNAVGVDVGPFPMDELLDFRRQYYVEHQRYRLAIRSFTAEMSRMAPDERDTAFRLRRAELDDLAADLERIGRAAWKRPASFALGLTAAAWTAIQADSIGALLAGAAAVLGASEAEAPQLGAYSYLFRARGRFTH